MEKRIVIVGNGIAGLSAARAIRKKNKSVKVTMISEEEYLTYDRTLLSDYLSDTRDEVIFTLEDEDWYTSHNINLKLGTRVDQIKTKSKNRG